jgi:mono/diheme cytochrome c family protein
MSRGHILLVRNLFEEVTMRPFLVGLLSGVVVLTLGAFCYVRFGFVDPGADGPVSELEEGIAMPSLDASVARHAANTKNPIDFNDGNLIAGMKVYQADCASCHGDVNQSQSRLAQALYPRAPQFVEDPPDMPENHNFYIIQHGIRMSGMPAWSQLLTEQQMWEVTTFLCHMHELPPAVSKEWRIVAASPAGDDSSSRPTSSHDTMQMK